VARLTDFHRQHWIYTSPSYGAVFRRRPPPTSSPFLPLWAPIAPPSVPAADNSCGLRGRRQQGRLLLLPRQADVAAWEVSRSRMGWAGDNTEVARSGAPTARSGGCDGGPASWHRNSEVRLSWGPPLTRSPCPAALAQFRAVGSSGACRHCRLSTVGRHPRHRCLSVVGHHPCRHCLRHQPRGLPHSRIRVSGRCWGNLYLELAPARFVVSVLGDGVAGRYSLCVGYLWNLAPLVVFFISRMGRGVPSSPWHYKLSVLHVGFLCSGIHLTSPSAVASGVVVLWSLCRCVVGRRPVVPLISLILNCSLLLHRLSLNLALEVVVRVGFGGLSESSSYSYQCRQRLWAFP
jgi:hypothetical protein